MGSDKGKTAAFTLQDDYGDSHEYFVTMHGAREGWRLAMRILKLAGRALGMALEVTPTKTPDAIRDIQAAAEGAGLLDASIDGEALGKALSDVAAEILSDDALLLDVLKHTTRDGRDLTNVAIFDSAFQGNYGELITAVVHVLKANFAPLFSRIPGGLSGFRLPPGFAGNATETPPK